MAEFYDSILVPLIFECYADDLANRARAFEPNSVLDVACGTGVLTRSLCRILPETCEIYAFDLHQAMLGRAKMVGTKRPVAWAETDVASLPYPSLSFDVALCQFSIMFFPDRVAAYREIRRVLRPGGTFLFSVWNEIERNDFASVVASAIGDIYSEDPPLFLARTPHGHGSVAEIQTELAAAGFGPCTLTQRDDVSRAASAELAAIAYCQATPLRNEILARDPRGLDRATAIVAEALRARFGEGAIEGKISAFVVATS